jgi:16S rRNA (cytosine1402-N4)-methyltransferase
MLMKNVHTTVLLQETVDLLNLKKGDIVVDGTLGAGGHTLHMLEKMNGDIYVLGIDLDQHALDRSLVRITNAGWKDKVVLVKGNFGSIEKAIGETHWKTINKVVLDLGFSSNQLELEGRGFSFMKDEPLVMTLSDSPEDVTAYDVVNHWGEETIADIIYGFGEEQFSRRIAKAIVEARKEKPIETTFQLADIVKQSVPLFYQKGRLHPATKTFQAIRIAVNRELENLKAFLESMPRIMAPKGRVAIISFHSLEDRIVKRAFHQMEDDGIGTRITKKPVGPSEEELHENPRSRSAKLRVFEIN